MPDPLASMTGVDPGWLLQNEQVSDEMLCDLLVAKFSAEIERLVAGFIASPAERFTAVDQILLQILRERRRFRSEQPGKSWLYRQVLQVCLRHARRFSWRRRLAWQRVASTFHSTLAPEAHFWPFLAALNNQQRLLVQLVFGQELSLEEVAALFDAQAPALQAGLKQIGDLLIVHARSCASCSAQHSSLSGLEEALRAGLQSPSSTFEAAAYPDWARSLLARLGREQAARRTRGWTARVLEAGLVATLVAAGIWTSTHTGELGYQIYVTAPVTLSTPASVPVSAAPTSAPLATPPDPAPSPEVAAALELARSSQSRWHTLWADVSIDVYHLETYHDGVGSPSSDIKRKQVWIELPGSARVIAGASPDGPSLSYAISNQRLTGQNFSSGQILDEPAGEVIPDTELKILFSPADLFPANGQFHYMGAEAAANRMATILDWSTEGKRVYRYWLDQQTGVVLRRQTFASGPFQPVVSDIQVTRIYFDAQFPAAIFEPFHFAGNYYAYDVSGSPEIPNLSGAALPASASRSGAYSARIPPVPPIPEPSGVNTARLSLEQVSAGWMQSAEGPGLELFAGQQDLGKLRLGGATILSCQRSPNGKWIAYNSPPQGKSPDTALTIANLSTIYLAHPVLPGGLTVGDFSFAPDSSRLTFFGCENSGSYCGLFLLDFATGKLMRLNELAYADYLAWAPDGRSLAAVVKVDNDREKRKLAQANLLMNELMALSNAWFYEILDTASGDVIYKRPFAWSELKPPADSPTWGWATPFKVPAVGFQACANPPTFQ